MKITTMAKAKGGNVYLLNCLLPNKERGYVGSSENIEKRFSSYIGGWGRSYIDNFIKKYGWESMQKIIITMSEDITERELRLWEDFYIGLFGTHYNEHPEFGLNLIRHPTFAISKEQSVREKISKTKTGTKLTETHKNKIQESTKGKIHIGVKRPYLSERNRTTKPMIGRTGHKNPMSKSLSVLDVDGNVIHNFESIKDAADFYGITRPAMRSRIKYNKQKYKFNEKGK
jgi:group I intron endonuclease